MNIFSSFFDCSGVHTFFILSKCRAVCVFSALCKCPTDVAILFSSSVDGLGFASSTSDNVFGRVALIRFGVFLGHLYLIR